MSETKNLGLKGKLASGLLALALLLTGWATGLVSPKLGASELGRDCATNDTASTSPDWLTPGTATTTNSVTCIVNGKDLRVNAWLIASSTATHYRILVQRSADNVDYYQEVGELGDTSTTTRLFQNNQLEYRFASSTLESQLEVNFSGTGTTSAKLVSFLVKGGGTNFLRLSPYLVENDTGGIATSSDRGAIWLEGVVTK